jgi:glutamine synthetase
MQREGLRYIPQSLSEAIDEFEADEVVQSALGPELAAEFIRIKRQEWVRYHSTVSRWETDQYLTLF